MQSKSLIRHAAAVIGAGALVLATGAVAGASTYGAKYNAMDAHLVPSAYKGVTLEVATDATYPPDESMHGTTMVGFDVDLMNAIATTLGVKIKENNVTFDSILAGITGGRYQIGNSSFTDNTAREKQVYFVDYFQAGEGVYAKKGENVKFTGLKSFCGLKIAVETGTVEQTDAQTAAKSCPASKKATVLAYPTQTGANLAVLSGAANVGFADSQIATYIVATSAGKYENVGSAINVAPYGIAFPKTATGHKMALAVQAAIKTLIGNGVYGKILSHWGVAQGGLAASKIVIDGAAG